MRHHFLSALTAVKQQRTEFDKLIKRPLLYMNHGEQTKLSKKDASVTKEFFDELCEGERLVDAELLYKTSFFYANLEILISQLSARFEGLQTVTKRFRCIHPTALTTDKDDALYQAVIELANIYSADLSSNFQCQLLSVCQIPRGEISKLDTVKDLV